MNNNNTKPFTKIQKILVFILFSVLGLLGNYYSLPFFFGVDFIFGSIAVILSIAWLGTVPALLVALIGGLYTLVLWGHPYALIIFLIEALFVGFTYQRLSRNMVMLDLLYWLLLGAPLVMLFYTQFLEMNLSTASFIALKQPLNGIFNAIIAGVMILVIQMRWSSGLGRQFTNFNIRTIYFYAFLSTVTIAGGVPILLDGYNQRSEKETFLAFFLQDKANTFISEMRSNNNLLKDDFLPAYLHNQDLVLVLEDKTGQIQLNYGRAKSREKNGEIHETRSSELKIWLPDIDLPVMKRWKQGQYVMVMPVTVQGNSYHLTLEIPAKTLVEDLEKGRLKPFISLAVIFFLGIIFSQFLSRWISQPLSNISRVSKHLSEKILEGDELIIPQYPVEEYDKLRNSLIVMSNEISHNIKELINREEKLAKKEGVLKNAQIIALMGSFEWHPDTGELLWSDQHFRLWGLEPQSVELDYETFEAGVHPEDLEKVRATLSSALKIENGGEYCCEYRVLRPDSSVRYILGRGIVEFDHEFHPVLMTGTVQDISESKKVENELIELRKKADIANETKGQFLANMSHEIRTPMNAIIGMSHLALQTELNEKQQNFITKVHRSAESLLGILNDILDFSKIEAGKLDFETVEFFLEDLMESLLTMVGFKAEEQDIELMFDIDPNVPTALIGDPFRIGQIVTNLCNNAVKFTSSGGEVVVAVKIKDETARQVFLHFSVRDNGIGMSARQRGNLFKSFTQGDTSTTRQYGGTGLGLVITKQLVELMRGVIYVESVQGKGSTFHVEIPLEKQEHQPELQKKFEDDLSSLRVLVVDDNVTSCEILSHIIESFKYQVDTVNSGSLAIEMLGKADKTNPYKLVLMDWRMPGMDGVETTRKIQHDLTITYVPTIIMISAYSKSELKRYSSDVNFAGLLQKPVIPSSLYNTILEAMGYKTMRQLPQDSYVDEFMRVAAQLKGVRVLLVEDNEINQELAEDLLTSHGLIVDVAFDGREALGLLANKQYDGVLMDCQMPVMDGYEATRKIRTMSQLKDLPVIAMTANAMAGDKEKALAAGMNDHIAKPIDPFLIFSTLAKWIKPRHGHTENNPNETQSGKQQANPQTSVCQLEGIDAEVGLKVMKGNESLYNRLLRKFSNNQKGFEQEFRAFLEMQDMKSATDLAHTLKGLAANLGMVELQEASMTLEQSCKENKDDIESKFQQVLQKLHIIFNSLQGF